MATELCEDSIMCIPVKLINFYPCLVHIINETIGLDREFYLDDLKDIKSGVIKLTDHEKELVFQALLEFYIVNGNKIYEDYIEEADKQGISRECIKTRAN